MSLHDPLIAVAQMRDHAREAMTLLAGKSRVDLETDHHVVCKVRRALQGSARGPAHAFQRGILRPHATRGNPRR